MKRAITVFAIATLIKVAALHAGTVALPSLSNLNTEISMKTNYGKWKLAEISKDAELLSKLADEKQMSTRMNVAKNLYTSSKTLQKLAKDERREVRECVAQNINTPAAVLKKLVNDDDGYVAQAAQISFAAKQTIVASR